MKIKREEKREKAVQFDDLDAGEAFIFASEAAWANAPLYMKCWKYQDDCITPRTTFYYMRVSDGRLYTFDLDGSHVIPMPNVFVTIGSDES